MVWLILGTLFVAWLVITDGNIFLRDKEDDSDPTNQSMDL